MVAKNIGERPREEQKTNSSVLDLTMKIVGQCYGCGNDCELDIKDFCILDYRDRRAIGGCTSSSRTVHKRKNFDKKKQIKIYAEWDK